MKKSLLIFKEGITQNWITILIFDQSHSIELINKKIQFYLSFNYSIKIINNN